MKVLNKIKSVFKQPEPLFKQFVKESYSQSGEDILIDYIFRLRKIDKPTYLDLGANHPFCLNNTFLFYQRGARGVNLDANPELIKLFNEHRQADINLNLGVGGQKGQLEFYVFDYDALSTFSKDEAEKLQASGQKLITIIPVEIVTVNDIVKNYCNNIYPDLISIDVEGVDEEIIESMELTNSKPKVICLETVEYTPDGTGKKRTQLIQQVIDKGFTVYADTNINTIFVENNFWFNS